MKENQRIFRWTESEKTGRSYVELPEGVPVDECTFHRAGVIVDKFLSECLIDPENPQIPEIYGHTMWFICRNHDIRVEGKRVSVNSNSHIKEGSLVVQWGPEAFLKCERGHQIPDNARFCPGCGTKIISRWI